MVDEKKNTEQIVEFLIKIGDLYLEDNEIDLGIEKYEEALSLSTNDEQILSKLGDAYATKGEYNNNSIMVFQKILEQEPDNKRICLLLSEVYLRNKKFDEEAYRIYLKSLNYYPQNHLELSFAIIHYSIKKKAFEVYEAISEQDLFPGFQSDTLIPYYLSIGWEYGEYKQVSNIYKFIINKKYNSTAHKYFVVNYLKYFLESNINSKDFCFELEDLQLCHSYIKSVKQFDHLEDIYIYLTLKKVLQRNFIDNVISEDQSVSEYELFLNDSSSSSIWDVALNKKLKIDTSFDFSDEIWFRVRNNKSANTSDQENNPAQSQLDLSDISNLMFIKIMNYNELKSNSDKYNILKSFDSLIHEQFAPDSIKYIKRVNDGYLLLGCNQENLLDNTIEFSKNYVYRDHDGKTAPVQFFIGMHRSGTGNDILDELNELFEIQQLYDSVLRNSNMNFGNNVIIVSESVFENINGKLIPNKESTDVSTLFNGSPIKTREILWRDPIDKIRYQDIQKIGRFKLVKELNANDLFTTFLSVDTFLDRLLILKVLNIDTELNENGSSVMETIKNSPAYGHLNDERVAIVYDIGQSDGFIYIAREYIESDTLDNWSEDSSSQNWRQSVNVIVQIAELIDQLHHQDIIHGRLKPSNIFISSLKQIKLADFGIPKFSYLIKDTKINDENALPYLAPEQLVANKFHRGVDIYAMGIMLYELINGNLPFKLENMNTYLQKPGMDPEIDLTSSGKDIPLDLKKVIQRAISDSSARYNEVHEFISDLKNVLDEKRVIDNKK